MRFAFPLACFSLALLAGCPGAGMDTCPAGATCDTGTPSGPVHGVAVDGTVDVTAQEAWPNRPAEPAPLTAQQIAEACAIEGACTKSMFDPRTSLGSVDDFMASLTAMCAQLQGSEERVIPKPGTNERWSWELRAALSSPRTCSAIANLLTTPADRMHCEEDGCWWDGQDVPVPKVTCAGDVATLAYVGTTTVRDCSHSYTHCDPTSSTGCTDRAPVACDPAGRDKCDGDVKLGCDAKGRVSFHDCSRYPNGRCVETATGASCAYDSSAPSCDGSAQPTCDGDVLSLCVGDQLQKVDCKKAGLLGCSRGHCVAN